MWPCVALCGCVCVGPCVCVCGCVAVCVLVSTAASWQAKDIAAWQSKSSCPNTAACNFTTLYGNVYDVTVFAGNVSTPSIAAGLDWIIAVNTEAPEYVLLRPHTSLSAGLLTDSDCAARSYRADNNFAMGVASLTALGAMFISIGLCCCLPSARCGCCTAVYNFMRDKCCRKGRNSAKQRGRGSSEDVLGDIALADFGRKAASTSSPRGSPQSARARTLSSPRARTLSSPRAATGSSLQLHSRPKQGRVQAIVSSWLPTVILIATVLFMLMAYMSWQSGDIFDSDVTRLSRATSLQLASSVNDFTTAAVNLVDTEIGAFKRGELPVTNTELNEPGALQKLQAFMYDLYDAYQIADVPVRSVWDDCPWWTTLTVSQQLTAVFVGYDNDYMIGCYFNTTGGASYLCVIVGRVRVHAIAHRYRVQLAGQLDRE